MEGDNQSERLMSNGNLRRGSATRLTIKLLRCRVRVTGGTRRQLLGRTLDAGPSSLESRANFESRQASPLRF